MHTTNLKSWIVCYGLITLFSFILIPFAYFFYEEYDEDQSIKDRIFGALKYTMFFVMISFLLSMFGLFLKPTTKAPKIDLDWFRKLLTDSSKWKNLNMPKIYLTHVFFKKKKRWWKGYYVCCSMSYLTWYVGVYWLYSKFLFFFFKINKNRRIKFL